MNESQMCACVHTRMNESQMCACVHTVMNESQMCACIYTSHLSLRFYLTPRPVILGVYIPQQPTRKFYLFHLPVTRLPVHPPRSVRLHRPVYLLASLYIP